MAQHCHPLSQPSHAREKQGAAYRIMRKYRVSMSTGREAGQGEKSRDAMNRKYINFSFSKDPANA